MSLFKKESSPLRKQQRDIISKKLLKKGVNAVLRHERDFLAQMIYATEYFSVARTVEQMSADFETMHQIVISPGRISSMLKKYIGQEILEKKSIPRAECKHTDQRRPYLYSKKG